MIRIEGDKVALYQWDLNQRVVLTDINFITAGIEVHFTNIHDSEECCMIAPSYSENGNMYADIPNKLLQQNGFLSVYLYVEDNKKAWTEYTTEFLVLPRKKPANYVYTPTEIWDYKAIEQRMTSAENDIVSIKHEHLPIKGGKLTGSLFTRDVRVGGAFDAYGGWGPRNPNIVDHTPLYESVKNGMYISTMQVKEEGLYHLVLPEGSNYLYKLEITQRNSAGGSSTRFFDVDQMPEIAAGTYSDRYCYVVGKGIGVIFSSKTRVDALEEGKEKIFDDGFVGKKRLNFQKDTEYEDNDPDCPYPAIEFSTNGPAEVKIWWVAGGDSRFFAIQSTKCSGASRLEVSGTFVAHGSAEVKNTLTTRHMKVEERAEVCGDLYVGSDIRADGTVTVGNDLIVGGFISCGESLDMNENDIKNAQTITVKGTSTLLGDVKVKNNANRDYTVKLRDVLDEALDYGFKSRVYVNEMPGANFTEKLQNAIDAVDDGGVVYIPSGNYELTFTANIDIDKSLTIMGCSKERPSISLSGTTSAFYVTTATNFSCENIVFISADGERRWIFDIFGAYGIPIETVSISNCDFDKCRLDYVWVKNIEFNGCRMTNPGWGMPCIRQWFDDGTNPLEKITITNCFINGGGNNEYGAIHQSWDGTYDLIIQDSYIENSYYAIKTNVLKSLCAVNSTFENDEWDYSVIYGKAERGFFENCRFITECIHPVWGVQNRCFIGCAFTIYVEPNTDNLVIIGCNKSNIIRINGTTLT